MSRFTKGGFLEETREGQSSRGVLVFRMHSHYQFLREKDTSMAQRSGLFALVFSIGVLCFSGHAAQATTVRDAVGVGEDLAFCWTINGQNVGPPGPAPDPNFRSRVTATDANGVTHVLTINGSGCFPSFDVWNNIWGLTKPVKLKFDVLAGNPTDWNQTILTADGKSVVYAGNITQDSAWMFAPLEDLPGVPWRIPDLAPASGGDPNLTVFTAVNLDLYLASNPLGFNNGNWEVGQTLSDLGISIVNGEVVGLDGIYWSTTEFEFDPDPLGRGFTPVGGDVNLLNSGAFPTEIAILQQHTPEPSSALLVAVGLALLSAGRRRRHFRRQ